MGKRKKRGRTTASARTNPIDNGAPSPRRDSPLRIVPGDGSAIDRVGPPPDVLASAGSDAAPELPPPGVMAATISELISSGQLDGYLQPIASATRARLNQVLRKTEVEAAARFEVGDRVQFGPLIRPKYLQGEAATVTGWAAKNVLVRLDRPSGRFPASDISVPPLALARVAG